MSDFYGEKLGIWLFVIFIVFYLAACFKGHILDMYGYICAYIMKFSFDHTLKLIDRITKKEFLQFSVGIVIFGALLWGGFLFCKNNFLIDEL